MTKFSPTINPTILPSYVNFFISQTDIEKVVSALIQSEVFFIIQPTHKEDSNEINETSVQADLSSNNKISENSISLRSIDIFIDDYLSKGIIPEISEVANHLGLKVPTFKLHFKKMYGSPFYEYYMNKKMKYASIQLLQGLPVSAVSSMVGYSQPIKFIKMFLKHFGVTPKQYQLNYSHSKRRPIF